MAHQGLDTREYLLYFLYSRDEVLHEATAGMLGRKIVQIFLYLLQE